MYNWLTTLLLFLSLVSRAQELSPNFRNLSVSDGLPSSEVHELYCDAYGRMWFATDRGVASFDGDELKSYSTSDGLVNIAALGFHVFSEDTVFVSGIGPEMSILNPLTETIIPYAYNKELLENCDHISVPQTVTRFNKGGILFSTVNGNGYLISVSKNGKLNKSRISGELELLNSWNGDRGMITSVFGLGSAEHTLTVQLDHGTVALNVPTNQYYVHKYAARLANGNIIFSLGKWLYILTRNGEFLARKQFQSEIVDLSIVDQEIWLGFVSGGALNYSTGSYYLRDHTITDVVKDKQGGYWFSTLEKGVFYTPMLNIFSLTKIEGKSARSLAFEKEYLFVGMGEGKYAKYNLKEDSLAEVDIGETDSWGWVLLETDDNDRLWMYNHKALYQWTNDRFEIRELSNETGPIYGLKNDGGGINVIGSTGAVLYNSDTQPVKVIQINKVKVCSDITWRGDTAYLGTRDGVIQFIDKKRTAFGEESCYRKRTQVLEASTNYLYAAFLDGGIARYDFHDFSTKICTRANGLPSDNVNCMASYGEFVWVGTSKGLALIESHDSIFEVQKIFTSRQGLVSNEILELELQGDRLYVGTKNGVSVLNLSKVLNFREFELRVVEASMGGIRFDLKAGGSFENGQNLLKITFNLLDYANESKRYRYRLKGFHDDWVQTQDHFIRIDNLKHGSYTLEIEYEVSPDVWQLVYESKAPIVIRKAYYQTAWFFILTILFVGLLVFYSVRLITGRLKRRKDTEKRVVELELKALRAQMNPHFTFNSINSIQDYILDKKPLVAHQYLSKFSKLIRNTLDFSSLESVLLNDIVENLELYIELEKMRFDIPFDHTIDCPVEMKGIRVPPLIIQPFIENAIWHGLKPLKSKGNLTVEFREEAHFILVSVKDSGVGVNHLKRSDQHTSRGVNIIRERLKHHNGRGENINYSKASPTGTIVEIRIKR